MFPTIRLARSMLLFGSAVALLACAEGAESDQLNSEETTLLSLTASPNGGPLTGLYHWDAPNGPRLVDAAGDWSGRSQDVALAFSPGDNWEELYDLDWQVSAWGKWVKARAGRRLVYSVAMLPGAADGSGPDGKKGTGDDVSLAACANGSYDAHWRVLARQLVDAGLGNSVIRLGWEFDGDWFAWSARGKEAQYASCYRRAVDAMRGVSGSPAFEFEWSSSDDIFFMASDKIEAAWPGDSYVDIIGVNAYDVSWVPGSYPFPSNCDATCVSQRRTVAWADMTRGVYQMRDRAVAHGKQLSIPEWGLWSRTDGHGGGDNADYVARIHAFVSDPKNRVAYQMYFDVDWTDGGHQISDVSGSGLSANVPHTYKTSFPNAAAKYKQLFGGASVTTPAPVVTTPAPVVTTPAPVVTTPAPVVTTPAPVVTTPAPVVTTPAPVVTTPAPVVTTPPQATKPTTNSWFWSWLSSWGKKK